MVYDNVKDVQGIDNVLTSPGRMLTALSQTSVVNLIIALFLFALFIVIIYYWFNDRKPAARGGF